MEEALSPGTRLGHYKLLSSLGQGGMGAVYRARDLRLGRVVALKVVSDEIAGEPDAERRLVEEARATARLAHPNIVTLYDVGVDAGRVWVALEYVKGKTLAERLNEGPAPAEEEAVRIALALAQALEAAHAAEIVHRDLKPANVLLGADGRPRILDFGIARVQRSPDVATLEPLLEQGEDGTGLSARAGTPRYMAPEQWEGRDDAPADVWALGLVLHILLTRVHPVPRRGAAEIAMLVLDPGPLPEVPELAHVPDALRALIRHCLDKDPDARPSAAEVARILAQYANDVTPRAPVPRPFPGLAPFEESDAASFAGRADGIDVCAATLEARGLLVVTGPSGVGKSSLVTAGLIPRLRGRGPLRVLHVRPGARPAFQLARALAAAAPSTQDELATQVDRARTGSAPNVRELFRADVPSLEEEVVADATIPRRLLAEMAKARSERVLLFLDQLEETSTLRADRAELRALTAAVAGAASPDEDVYVVITVRDDYLGQIPWGELAADVFAATYQLPAPDGPTLRKMIVEPLMRLGYRFEDPAAPDELAAAFVDLPYALPLMQLALSRLWAMRDEAAHTIPRAATEALGDPALILSQRADEIIDTFDATNLERAQRMFLGLVTPERARARATTATLSERIEGDAEPLVEQFVEAGILARTPDDEIELAHEAIIDRWERLAAWLDRTDVASAHAKALEQQARRWLRGGKLVDGLLAGEQLRQVELGLGERTGRLSDLARELLGQSRQTRARQARIRLALRGVLLGSLVVALGAALVAAWALRERETVATAARARAERDRTVLLAVNAAERLGSGDLLGARAFARASLENGNDVSARSLVDQLRQNPLRFQLPRADVIYSAVRDPRSDVVWLASQSASLLRLDTRTGHLDSLDGHGDQVTAVTILPDGTVLSGDWGGDIRTWAGDESQSVARLEEGAPLVLLAIGRNDVAVVGWTGGRIARLRIAEGRLTPIDAPTFARHSATWADERLWIGSGDGRVVGLDPMTGHIDREVRVSGSIDGLAVSASGARVAAATEGAVTVLDVATGETLATWAIGQRCREASFLGEDRVLAACDGLLHQLDVPRSGWITHEPDGALITGIAAADEDVTVTTIRGVAVYARGRLDRVPRLPVPESLATAAGVSAEHGLAFVGTQGFLHVFDLQNGQLLRAIPLEQPDGPRELVVDGDAVLLAHGPLLSRFELPQLRLTHTLTTGTGVLDAMDVDGDRVVCGSRDGQITQWSIETGLAQPIVRLEGSVQDIVVTEDGGWVAITPSEIVRGDASGVVDRRALSSWGHSLARASDGSWLVALGSGRLLRLADLHAEPVIVADVGTRIYAVRTFHDGRFAFASADRRARLRSPDGRETVLSGHRGEVNTVAFSADGQWLVTAGDDATLRTWHGETGVARWETTGFAARASPDDSPTALPIGAWSRRAEQTRCEVADARGTLTVEGAVARSWPSASVRDVVALPWGCAVLADGAVGVWARTDQPLAPIASVHAIASAGEALLVATEEHIVKVTEAGETRSVGAAPASVTALLQVEGVVWWGDDHGLVSTLDGRVRLASPSASVAVTHLGAGPSGTLVVGRADGRFELWEPTRREILQSTRLHGAVVDSALTSDTLHGLSELGDRARIDVTSTAGGWCSALREMWSESALVWRDRALEEREPPQGHACAQIQPGVE